MLLDFDGSSVITEKDLLPAAGGVYFVFKDEQSTDCLYVGSAESIANRVCVYRHHKISIIPYRENLYVKWKIVDDPNKRVELEKYYIRIFKPKYNETYKIDEEDQNIIHVGAKISQTIRSNAERVAQAQNKSISEFVRDSILDAIRCHDNGFFADTKVAITTYLSHRFFKDKDMEAKALLIKLID